MQNILDLQISLHPRDYGSLRSTLKERYYFSSFDVQEFGAYTCSSKLQNLQVHFADF